MKVFLEGKWYDAEEVPIVVKLDNSDKKNISNMHPDSKHYMVYPDSIGKDILEKIIQEIKNNQ